MATTEFNPVDAHLVACLRRAKDLIFWNADITKARGASNPSLIMGDAADRLEALSLDHVRSLARIAELEAQTYYHRPPRIKEQAAE